MAPSRVIIEADGGSRGNPGPAAYGALVRDADTGQVVAEAAEAIGFATNNVAEYRGLIAGLQLVRELVPDPSTLAGVEVRMDSKLVVEQMAGRWRIKHPDMQPLALQARRLAPAAVQWTWVPRERNTAADALLNKVLDGGAPVWRIGGQTAPTAAPVDGAAELSGPPTVCLLYAGSGPADAVELAPVTTLASARSTRDKLLRTYAGQDVRAIADPTTITLLVTYLLGGKQDMAGRLELAPGSVTELVWYADGRSALRRFGAL